MIVWSLFAGIGGIDLGLERAGMETVLQVEINDFCQKVLEKHWPNTLKFRDIVEFNDLISSVVGSPARMSVSPANGQDSQEQEAGSGLNSSARFAYYDPDTSSWRTYQDCLALMEDETLDEFSETWPKAGTMRNGKCYQQDSLEPHTYGEGSLLSLGMWPTPTQRDYRSGKGKTQEDRGRSSGPSLSEVSGGTLNPTWVEWLMGFPLGWTDLERSGMPLSPK